MVVLEQTAVVVLKGSGGASWAYQAARVRERVAAEHAFVAVVTNPCEIDRYAYMCVERRIRREGKRCWLVSRVYTPHN